MMVVNSSNNVNCNMYPLHLNGTIPRTSTPILLIILTIGLGVQSAFFVTVTCYMLHVTFVLLLSHNIFQKIMTYLTNYFSATKHGVLNR